MPVIKKQSRTATDDALKQIYKLLLRLVSPLASIPVQETDAVTLVRPEDVAYITTGEDRLRLYDRHGNEWTRYGSLKEMENKLKGDERFYRSHRSYIINLYQVRKIITDGNDRWILFRGLPDDKRADVSRGNIPELETLLGIREGN